MLVFAAFALSADDECEKRMDTLQLRNRDQERRFPRDGMTTLHKLPPLQLQRILADLNCLEEFRGLLHIHLGADRFVVSSR